MDLNRRDFIKLMGGTAAALTFPSVFFQGCKKAIEKAAARTPVIWLQGQSCSGCSVSLVNTTEPKIAALITEHISLNFHHTSSGGTGDALMKVLEEAVDKKRKDFVLVVEGSIPTKSLVYNTLGEKNGRHVGFDYWVEELGKNAVATLAVGTCAAFGGIPAGRGNVTGATSVEDFYKMKGIKKPLINIPGCPSHPDWIVGTVVYFMLKGAPPELDEYKRPKMYFGKTVHENCENLRYYKKGIFAKQWGDEGCLYNLGCLGIDTGCDAPVRKWNGTNSCTGSGSGCIGCTEKVFPDTGSRGLYQQLQGSIDTMENDVIKNAKLNISRIGGVING